MSDAPCGRRVQHAGRSITDAHRRVMRVMATHLIRRPRKGDGRGRNRHKTRRLAQRSQRAQENICGLSRQRQNMKNSIPRCHLLVAQDRGQGGSDCCRPSDVKRPAAAAGSAARRETRARNRDYGVTHEAGCTVLLRADRHQDRSARPQDDRVATVISGESYSATARSQRVGTKMLPPGSGYNEPPNTNHVAIPAATESLLNNANRPGPYKRTRRTIRSGMK